MVSGSWPPERCGIGDYSNVLSASLEAQGIEVDRIALDDWGIGALGTYRTRLKSANADIVHVQYPAVGYGRSLLPALTPYLTSRPCVVTLHEYEIFKPYRRPWFAPYARRAKARIFSRESERQAFARRFPGRKGADHILAIGSNIPKANIPVERLEGSIAFFGLFWPGKGLEDFLELARLLRNLGQKDRVLTIIGALVSGQENFAAEVREAAEELDIRMIEGQPAATVAEVLAGHHYAYLPFPEGADERRGSLAAAIVNGCIPVTRHGACTPDWLKAATLPADTPLSASILFSGPPAATSDKSYLTEPLSAAAERYDWSAIAGAHAQIYSDILARS